MNSPQASAAENESSSVPKPATIGNATGKPMGSGPRIATIILWAVLVLAMIGVIGTGVWTHLHPAAAALPDFYQVPSFSLTDQDGRTVTDQTLRGHVWICDFIFTRCPGPCKEMSGQMTRLQKAVPDRNMTFVSFSVDPEFDTPTELKEYAHQWAPGETRWELLTGPASQIFGAARGLKLSAMPSIGNRPIQHDERFLLVDATGQVRGIYESADAEKMSQLPLDMKALLDQPDRGPSQ